MNIARENHRKAMELSDQADSSRREARNDEALDFYSQAFDAECLAAQATDVEPSRSILHRSAAWLGLEARRYLDAQRMVHRGLGFEGVPDDLAEELRAVLSEAEARAVVPTLSPPSGLAMIGLSLEGGSIAYGSAPTTEVLPRVTALENLVYRTIERREGKAFRRGHVPLATRKRLEPRMTTAPGSFKIQLSLGSSQLDLFSGVGAIVDEVVECIQLVQQEGEAGLRNRLSDELYLQNCLALTRRLAPDGRRVRRVCVEGYGGVTARPIVLGPMPSRHLDASESDSIQEVIGELRAADGTGQKASIKLIVDEETIQVRVSDALLEDIVRPFFGRRVKVLLKSLSGPGRVRLEMVGIPELVDEPL